MSRQTAASDLTISSNLVDGGTTSRQADKRSFAHFAGRLRFTNVLVPYSARMKKLLVDPEGFYDPKKRPSGHDISMGFGKNNGGAIPSNLLQIPNSESNGAYLAGCKAAGIMAHPARFPAKLPEFFIRFLTEPGDLVVDIFAGPNTTPSPARTEPL